jgi:SOS response regulatory protein OraA/RecX
VEEDARADALDTLERVGYVDDERFAVNRAQALAGRGYGNEAIRAFLEEEGAGVEAVEQALGALEPEADRVRALVARGGATPRLAAQLQRKGFGQEAL